MKRFIFALLSVVLIFAFMLGGCSCSGCSSGFLEFSPLFYGGAEGESPRDGYVQQSVYKVELKDSYADDISKSQQVSQYIEYDYSGTYTSKLEVTSNQLPGKINTDMRSEIQKSGILIYKLTTTLQLQLTYTVKGKTQEVKDDFVITESYFTSAESGFMPIYASTQSSMHYIGIDSNGANISLVTANNTVTYNEKNYIMTTKYDNDPATTKTYDYDRQTLIDNSQLLFVMRNVNLADNEQYELPVVSYQYGQGMNIMITNDGVGKTQVAISEDNPLTVNGQPYGQANLNVKRYKFKLSTDKNSGSNQYLFFQDGASGNLGNRSVMYRYLEPIYALGTYSCLGVLDYTLTDISFGYSQS